MHRSQQHALPAFTLLQALALLAMTGGAPAGAEVDLATPYQGPAQTLPIPPLDVDGVLPEAPLSATGATRVHGGRHTLFPDTASPAAVGASCADLLPEPFATEAAPALLLHWNEAHDEAHTTVGQLDGGTIQDFFDVFEDAVELLGGDVEAKVGPTVPHCVTWTPVQGRFLRRQWSYSGKWQIPWMSEKLHTYHPQPRPFREMRERGARLYCAARTAQFAQGEQSFSLGERVGFSVNVLGQTVDFLVVEPTLALDGPERFTGDGAKNGAQAFEVPMLFGTRITPIRGLPLPGFREVRVPVSLVTADTEVQTASDLGPVHMGASLHCGWTENTPYPTCTIVPHYETKHRKEHLTISHLDALRTAYKHSTIEGETEVMRIGPVAVALGFDITYFLGVSDATNDRVLDIPGLPAPAGRKGRLWLNPASGARWHDGAWTPRLFYRPPNGPTGWYWTVLPDGLTDAFWRELVNLATPPPLDLRLAANDDHSVGSGTGLGIGGSLSGVFGGSYGPFTINLKVTGELTGTVTQHHMLSDALLAQDQGQAGMTPVTGLTVRPRQTGEADLLPAKGTLNLHLGLPWPLDDIDITKDLFAIKKVTLANYDTDDGLTQVDEKWNFRLGTGSARGAVTTQPTASFHFPGGGEAASFPIDVAACLADDAPNPPVPPPCEAAPPQGAVPSAEVCVFGPGEGLREIAPGLPPLPPDVCNHLSSWEATLTMFDSEQRECLLGYLEYLCSATSQQQGAPSVVAHVVDLTDPADGQALADAMEVCANAFGVPAQDGSIDSSAIAEGFIEAGVCNADGKILAEGEILGAAGPPQQPPLPQTGPACH